jgi:hypothetical protein
MSRVVNAWIQLNRDARRVCKEASTRLAASANNDPFVGIHTAFLHKATETLSAVNVLYAHKLEEPAQALIRVLFELRINFDCLLTMARQDPQDAFRRVVDSMMLEKIKQVRAAQFGGISPEHQEELENREKEIAECYSPEEFTKLRKHGFTGIPIEQRATMTGHEVAYSIVYRNFSRNVHSTDYVESYIKTGLHITDSDEGYRESRDIAAHYTAHFSAVGMAEFANHVFNLDLDAELEALGKRQKEIRALDAQPDT